MRLHLQKKWIEELLRYPESGMGYQQADLILKTGERIRNVVILNAEFVLLSEEQSQLTSDDIAKIEVPNRKGAE